MGRRRLARELALQALYIVDTSDVGPKEAFRIVNRKDKAEEKALAFAKSLFEGTTAKRRELDREIKAATKNWALDRMASVDRNLLRLAAYEILHGDTPATVVLDEAIEIARKFSTGDSTRFINGILDKIKERRPHGDQRPG